MKQLIWSALFIVVASVSMPAVAAEKPATSLINSLADEALGVLSNQELSSSERQQRLKPLFGKYLDMDFMARFVLGQHWRRLSKEQKEDFTEAFKQYVRNVYASRVGSYSGEELRVEGSRELNEKDTMVSTRVIRPNQPPVAIDWRVRTANDDSAVIDVVVEDVSQLISQREEFNSFLQRNSVDDLITKMRTEAER
ncbi:MAG TPA: ABC transporter substrate-binding protein [Alphaproteobacteria bacterium]|nr:ABC transporter substrate-binding protein [Alphaproteobacteria bacterium]